MKKFFYVLSAIIILSLACVFRPELDGVTDEEGKEEFDSLNHGSVYGSMEDSEEWRKPVRGRKSAMYWAGKNGVANPRAISQYVRDLAEKLGVELRCHADRYLDLVSANSNQRNDLGSLIDDRVKIYEGAIFSLMNGSGEVSAINLAADAGLEDIFIQLLDIDQWQIYNEIFQVDLKKNAEVEALVGVRELNVLGLNSSQEDVVYEILLKEGGVREKVSVIDFVRREAMEGEDVLDCLGFRAYLDSKEEKGVEVTLEVVRHFIENRVKRFDGVFTDRQKSLYRADLEQKLACLNL